MNNNYEQQSDFIIAKYTEELSQREGVRSFMKNNVKEKIASQASTLNFNHLTFLERYLELWHQLRWYLNITRRVRKEI